MKIKQSSLGLWYIFLGGDVLTGGWLTEDEAINEMEQYKRDGKKLAKLELRKLAESILLELRMANTQLKDISASSLGYQKKVW